MNVHNWPGWWDFFISHSRRSPEAVLLARQLEARLREAGYSVWLDVAMRYRSEAAMKEGAQNSAVFIAVVNGPCVNNDRRDDPEEDNAYFRRRYCLQELKWAIEAGRRIQPVVRWADKQNIKNLIDLAPKALRRGLGKLEWVDFNMDDYEHFALGVKKLARIEAKPVLRRERRRAKGSDRSDSKSDSYSSDVEVYAGGGGGGGGGASAAHGCCGAPTKKGAPCKNLRQPGRGRTKGSDRSNSESDDCPDTTSDSESDSSSDSSSSDD